MLYPKALLPFLCIFAVYPAVAGNGPEFPIGSVIQNFALPLADATGKKTAIVNGKRATV